MSFPKVRILLVDDDLLCARVVGRMLESDANLAAEFAGDGAAALSSIAADPPALVLLDIGMAGVDGLEVLRNLRSRPETRTLPVVVLSGRDAPGHVSACLRAGADDVIDKPVLCAELLARVHARLRLQRLADEVEAGRAAEARQRVRTERDAAERGRRVQDVVADLQAPLAMLQGDLEALRVRLGIRAGADVDLADIDRGARAVVALIQELDQLHRSPPVRSGHPAEFAPAGLLRLAVGRTLDRHGGSGPHEVLIPVSLPRVQVDPELLERCVQAMCEHVLDGGGAAKVEVGEVGGDLLVSVATNAGQVPLQSARILWIRRLAEQLGGCLRLDFSHGQPALRLSIAASRRSVDGRRRGAEDPADCQASTDCQVSTGWPAVTACP